MLAVTVSGLSALGPGRLHASPECVLDHLVDFGFGKFDESFLDLGISAELSTASEAPQNVVVLGRIVLVNRDCMSTIIAFESDLVG